jgi:hypothetical protein
VGGELVERVRWCGIVKSKDDEWERGVGKCGVVCGGFEA